MNITALHQETWQGLLARRAHLPHALLFAGPRGVGKYSLARHFVEFLLCEKAQQATASIATAMACGACPACHWMAQGNHPDFRLVQPEVLAERGEDENDVKADSKKKPSQQIIIDQIRALDDFLHIGTHRQGLRIILIHPAEAMNRATANALLKSLEEPPPNTLFLLVCSEQERLLPTIRSRCQLVSIPLPSHDLAKVWLQNNGQTKAADYLALAGGAPFLAQNLADDHALFEALSAEWSRGAALDALRAAATIDRLIKAAKYGLPLKQVVEYLQKWLCDLMFLTEGLPVRYFQGASVALQTLVPTLDTHALLKLTRQALQYRRFCEQPVNSRLFLEEIFLAYRALFIAS